MPAYQYDMTAAGVTSYQAPQSGPKVGDYQILGTVYGDSIIGAAGADTLYGGYGNDSLNGHIGNDTLFGEYGDDWLWGDEGNDKLYGGAGRDQLFGGNGNDTLNGGGTDSGYGLADNLQGGSGNDLYYYDFSLQGVTIISDASGGQIGNQDILQLENVPSNLTIAFGNDKSTLYLYKTGEMDDGNFDNGLVIQNQLTNTGYNGAGTLEYAFINGSQFNDWMPFLYESWDSVFA
jgi:Ca2+-binding RTX toxin-like protein